MKLQLIILSLTLLIFSCETQEDVKTEAKKHPAQVIENQNNDHSGKITKTKLLTIQGKNIWVRETPTTGNVVMKLNTGDVCEVLDETKEMQVRDMLDKWYKIKFNDTIGWVFGSQTSLKKEIKSDGFKKVLVDFSKNIKNQKFSNFIHKDLGIKIMYNPGAFCILDTIKSFRVLNFNKETIQKNIFNKKPKGGFCEGYPKVKNGLYFWKIKYNDLPKSADLSNPDSITSKAIYIPKKYKTNKLYQVQLINNEYHQAYFFFININKSWYLLLEDYCDCSA